MRVPEVAGISAQLVGALALLLVVAAFVTGVWWLLIGAALAAFDSTALHLLFRYLRELPYRMPLSGEETDEPA
ncbi:hypothetical protein [Glaciihabitans sp. dw_435]|uniref:hypothetical protein n=1 Tax=Glaciihabitans sp. dw_435 TaxID=2720081 RepID=UPI001BD65673|nr:hypothetical protein [Glaciihabitans sp. dw_435]